MPQFKIILTNGSQNTQTWSSRVLGINTNIASGMSKNFHVNLNQSTKYNGSVKGSQNTVNFGLTFDSNNGPYTGWTIDSSDLAVFQLDVNPPDVTITCTEP